MVATRGGVNREVAAAVDADSLPRAPLDALES